MVVLPWGCARRGEHRRCRGAGAGSGSATDRGGGDGRGAAAEDDERARCRRRGHEAIAGTWSVDTSIGEFSYEDSTGTFVGFRVDEELQGIGSTTAVGRTPEITGTLVIEGTTVTAVTIEADMTAITTNESRRDDKVQSALDTGAVPNRHVRAHRPIELGDAAPPVRPSA